ncbi:hypothetical protein M9H77_26593 [Catharanthus roseus]|uniref:Uncharacterized protein n=1 Tax=Catharanthus roseus TaxID=4058 RepID=A0ACC0ABZ8_CATRO|nr:hypothetical protein M9H77_26593 [Catharanthus roseus]
MLRSRAPYKCDLFKMIYNCCKPGFDHTQRQRIALYMAGPPYEGLFRWHGRFRLGRVDPLEEGRSTVEGMAQSNYVDTASCSAVGGPPSALMCLDSLRLPSCARNPHINSGQTKAR